MPTSKLAPDPWEPAQKTSLDTVSQSKYIPALDGLRGTAVLLVLLTHFATFYPPQSNLVYRAFRIALGLGWSGVDLFFVLSGFLITGILVDAKQKKPKDYFRSFYIRRVLRIFPLYYCFLLVLLLLHRFLPEVPDWHELVWYFAYLQNWRHAFGIIPEGISHFWSLAIEEQFYMVWPLVIYYTNRDSLLRTIGSIFGGIQILRWILVLLFSVSSTFLYTATVTRLDGVILGSFVAIALRDPWWLEQIRKYGLLCGLAATMAFLALAAVSGTSNIFLQITPFVVFAPVALALMFSSLLTRILLGGGGFFDWKWLRLAGKYSYAMYVFHYPLGIVIASEAFRKTVFDYGALATGSLGRSLFWGTAMVFGCTLATFLLAWFSWWALESRMVTLKSKLT